MKDLLTNLKNPPNGYRPAPLWVWNDEMDKGQIEWQLKQLATHGFGGAFVHPRPGLVTPYLSDEWFDLWGYALQVAKELGLKLYIYDENSYPSGFGGGHVSSQHEDKLSTFMRYQLVDSLDKIPADYLAVYAVKETDEKLTGAVRLDTLPKEEWGKYGEKYVVITFQDAKRTGWMAGFGYVDLLRPEVTKTFLDCTHEAYFSRFGQDFGKTIPAIFTDEPSVGMYGDGGMPYSKWFLGEFEKRNGYSLEKHLPCVFEDVEGDCFEKSAQKVRFDYFDTIHELWTKNAIKPIGDWCEEHGIQYTGHYMEHLWPLLTEATSPAVQSNYEYHGWPAVDMLLSSYLKDTPTHAITHTLREVGSAANQFGKERVVCELYGAGGWDSTFDDYKRMADWVLVNGVNFVNQHLTYSTIYGARKHDHPQSFDWREPWWDEYTAFNDYLSRACYLLSQGKCEKKILVLNPTLTGYITPPERCDGDMFKRGGFDAIKNPDMKAFLTLCQTLTDCGWEYDLGDEYTLARHAKVTKDGLQVVGQTYSAVLISGDMKTMLSSTLATLFEGLRKGVKVVGVDFSGCLVDGDRATDWQKTTFMCFDNIRLEAVNSYLGGVFSRKVVASTPFSAGVTYMRRVLDNGDELYFFVNQSMSTYESELTFAGLGVERLDLFTGEKLQEDHKVDGEKVSLFLSLARNQSAAYLIKKEKTAGEVGCFEEKTKTEFVPLVLKSVSPDSDNLYPIIYADYKDEKELYVKRLCDKIFSERGFDGNPWDNKVQYKRSLLDKNTFGTDSAVRVSYHFTLADAFMPNSLKVVAERPDLCHLEINGQKVDWTGENFLDRHFAVAEIAPFVKEGENVVALIAEKFDVRLEVDAVYVKGDFSVFIKDGKWIICPPDKMKMGSWKGQGYPFYPFAVEYTFSAELTALPKKAWLDVKDYSASALSLEINGQKAGLMHADGKRKKEIGEYLTAGSNTFRVRVCGSHKNFLGPHFDTTRGSAWPAMWKASPAYQPNADEYDLLDYGLFELPVLEIER